MLSEKIRRTLVDVLPLRFRHALRAFRDYELDRQSGNVKAYALASDDQIIAYKSQAWQSGQMAETYKRGVEQDFFGRVVAGIFLEHIKPTDKILDIGAGTGRLSLKMAELGCEVTAVDISPQMLSVLNETKGELKVSTLLAPADALPFENCTFDVVTHLDFLLHFPNWRDFLVEHARVLKNNGLMIFSFLNGDNLDLFNGDRREASLFLANGDFVAGAGLRELDDFCERAGCERLLVRPYNYFNYNVFLSSHLSAEEARNLSLLLNKAMKDSHVMDVMAQLDEQIISGLSPELCTSMIVVLRKW